MAMKEVWTHPKFKALKMRLKLADWEAVGLLEAVWGICIQVKSCRAGIIAWDARRIADYIGWDRCEPEDMVEALVASGWLDRTAGGLSVHDWAHHSPRWIRGVLEKQRKASTTPNSVRDSVQDSGANSVADSAGRGMGKGKGEYKKGVRTEGEGGLGEGVFDPPPEWWERVHRWPDHATLTRRGLEAQIRVCRKTLNPEGLETALEARLLRSLVLGWAETGQDPWDALQGILGGLDDDGVKDRGALLRSRVSKFLERVR